MTKRFLADRCRVAHGLSSQSIARSPRDLLYAEAKHKGIPGRSRMNKAQLERAVDR